ncbi:MAG TPA: hypothetical protein VFF63_03515 [Candidatus Babeliales bacterium]|nr:hypothetical protein [Candidatus Babeliales bacterium]
MIDGAHVHDEKRPLFLGRPRMAASKLAVAKNGRARSEQDASDERLRVGTVATSIKRRA